MRLARSSRKVQVADSYDVIGDLSDLFTYKSWALPLASGQLVRGSPPAVLDTRPYLQAVGALSKTLPATWAAGDEFDAAESSCIALTPPRWGKKGFLVRKPRTILIIPIGVGGTGSGAAVQDAAGVAQLVADFAGLPVNVEAFVSFPHPHYSYSPLLACSPLTAGSFTGQVPVGTQYSVNKFQGTVDPTFLDGGDLYVALVTYNRMDFGTLTGGNIFQPAAGGVSASVLTGYTIVYWTADTDDPVPAPAGCVELDSVITGSRRAQTFFDQSQAAADRVFMLDMKNRRTKMRLAFWSDESAAGGGIVNAGNPTAAAAAAPGDPATAAALIDGGAGVVTYNVLTMGGTSAGWAAQIAADAKQFFSL